MASAFNRTPTIGSALKKVQTIAREHPYAFAGAVTIAALAASALANRHFSMKAERDNPPGGRFLEVNGVRLHYVERGEGQPLVLLHGNGSMIQDFEFERSRRSCCEGLPRYRLRPTRLWAQQSASQRCFDPGRAGRAA